MKTFVKLLMCVACLALLSSCEKDDDFNELTKVQVLRAFDAGFTVYDVTPGNSETNKGKGEKIWKGEGESLLLGKFTAEITLFCDMLIGYLCDLNGTLYFADGSELYFSVDEGNLVCMLDNRTSRCDIYHFKFGEIATIEGGTKRLEGAKGSFKTEVLIHNAKNPDWFAQFACDGKIVLQIKNE